jgi:hypothetical protein
MGRIRRLGGQYRIEIEESGSTDQQIQALTKEVSNLTELVKGLITRPDPVIKTLICQQPTINFTPGPYPGIKNIV